MAAPKRRLLIIPGAQKAATTSLYGLLLQHEAIHSLTPPPDARWDENWKEPHFFALKEAAVRPNLDWYRDLLGDEPGWYVDASTSYLTAPRVPELVQALSLAARYLVILRDPVERALSAYHHMHREDPPVDRRSFDEIIDVVWQRRNDGVAAAEDAGIRRAIDEGQVDLGFLQTAYLEDLPASSVTDLQDEWHLFKYLQQGMYSRHLRSFEAADAPLLVVCMEELVSEPSTARDLFSFLDLTYQGQSLPHLNQGASPPAWRQRIRSLLDRVPGLATLMGWTYPESSRSRPEGVSDETLDRTRRLLADEYEYWANHRPSFVEQWRFGHR